jgi:uncharacterized membrane protein
LMEKKMIILTYMSQFQFWIIFHSYFWNVSEKKNNEAKKKKTKKKPKKKQKKKSFKLENAQI